MSRAFYRPTIKRRKYTPTIGAISEGTLRTEDLLPRFAGELKALRPQGYTLLVREAYAAAEYLERIESDTLPKGKPPVLRSCPTVQAVREKCESILGEVQDTLSEHAPPYIYFGTAEGDGACFGWWPAFDCIDQLDKFSELAEVPADFFGDFAVVNDHGNIEVYTRYGNRRIANLFGAV